MRDRYIKELSAAVGSRVGDDLSRKKFSEELLILLPAFFMLALRREDVQTIKRLKKATAEGDLNEIELYLKRIGVSGHQIISKCNSRRDSYLRTNSDEHDV